MNEEFRVSQRPQMRDQGGTPNVAVAARPNDYGIATPQPNAEAAGLLDGLASFNPALQRYAQRNEEERLKEEAKAKAAAELAGKAAAQQPQDARTALTGATIPLPYGIKPAYADQFYNSMSEALGHRAGIENKTAAVAEYEQLKNTEGFNQQEWLQKKRQEALAGLNDPQAIATVGAHFSELEGLLKADFLRDNLRKQEEVRQSSALTLASDVFTADMNPEQLKDAYAVFRDRARGLQLSSKDAARYVFMQIQHLSNKLGGAPALFDIFDVPETVGDQKGQTLRALNPELAQHIDNAREQAKVKLDKEMLQKAEQGNAVTLMEYETDIDTKPQLVTQDRILRDMTQYGAVRSPTQAAALWNRAQDSMRKLQAKQLLMGHWDDNTMFELPHGTQAEILREKAQPMMDALKGAMAGNDPAGVAAAAQQLMLLQSSKRATVAIPQLEGLLKTFVSNVPNAAGPTPQFLAAAELYKAASASPRFREMYFDEDTRRIMEVYTQGTAGGSDAESSYKAAYTAVSPEGKAAREKVLGSPEFAEFTKKALTKYAVGSSFWPQWAGGNGRPEVSPAFVGDVQNHIKGFIARNPTATDKDIEESVKAYTEDNFVHDTTTRQLIKVPKSMNGPQLQEALSGYTEELTKKFNLGDRNGNWRPILIPAGTEGAFNVMMMKGEGGQTESIGTVSLQKLTDDYRAKKHLTEDEKVELGRMRVAVKKGEAFQISDELAAKADGLGLLKWGELDAIRKRNTNQMLERIKGIPQMDLGQPTAANLQFLPKANVNVDHKLTAQVAAGFLNPSLAATPGGDSGLAPSLITMGEAVVLRAYDDPAQGAGKNIGMGYNLKANAKNAADDLKRAGVPVERIQDVIDGKADITTDQAQRLLQVALPRYEKQVREVAESTAPGLWNRMTAPQRAVMLDVAWQVGDAGKFKKAWAALAAGDMPTFAAETKVFYTDRSGAKKEDTRRNNLRAAMLAGSSVWTQTLNKFGSMPSDKLQALASAQ